MSPVTRNARQRDIAKTTRSTNGGTMKHPDFDTRPKKISDHRKFGSTSTRKNPLTVKQRVLTATVISTIVATIAILERFANRRVKAQKLKLPLVGDHLELRKKKVTVTYPTLQHKKRRTLPFSR